MGYRRFEGESEEELILRICQDKEKIGNWDDVADILNDLLGYEYTSSKYRKQFQSFQKMLNANRAKFLDDETQLKEIEEQVENLRKEKIKLQTLNIERNRVDRNISRQELYFEHIGSICNALEVPKFEPLFHNSEKQEYLVSIADIHYGAKFESVNNVYSPQECKHRFEILLGELIDFVEKKQLSKISIVELGDSVQGILRISDLKINDSSVTRAIVEVSHLIASFLNQLSAYVQIEYYHVPSANHTQIRPLGTKASELSDEDFEYVISHYIKDLVSNNDRVNVHLADEKSQFVKIDVLDYNVLALHGHQIKNIENSLKDLTMLNREFIDYLILGHFHGGKEMVSNEGFCSDSEILMCPSFIGSDPYSDSLMKGSKASVKIYGFNDVYGHNETYKIILN